MNAIFVVLPGGRFGVVAPRNAGVTVIGPFTTAHEWTSPPWFVHVIRTRQPFGMLTTISPRP